jgi:beta-lactamase class A
MVSLIVILAQLLYPTDRVLPYIRVNGEPVSGMNRRELIDYLYNKYGDAPLTVTINGSKITSRVNEAGLIINYLGAVDQALSYKGWERWVPYSSFTKAIGTDIRLSVIPDKERLDQFIGQITDKCYKPAKDASVAVDGQALKLVPGKSGVHCPYNEVKQQLESLTVYAENNIEPSQRELKPDRTDEEIKPLLGEAGRLVNSNLRVSVAGKYHTVPPDVIAGWIGFVEDSNKNIIITLKDDKVGEFISTLNHEVFIAAVPTTMFMVDGKETRREIGKPGQGIDLATTTSRVKAAALRPDAVNPVAWAAVTKTDPPVLHSKNFSHTQAGLEVMLVDLANSKGNVGIALHEIGGPGRVANAYGTKHWTTASTYKMFVAHYILKKIESGELKWNSETTNGFTVTQCMDEMIILSQNMCSVYWGTKYGWANIEKLAHQHGMTNTFLPRGDFRSTPIDEAMFMRKLDQGELLKPETKKYLIDLFKKQHYRSGIPRGVVGTVANKIGFVDGYLNDAGIVYGRQGTYVLAVMTYGSSWSSIADVARQVDTYLNE